MGNQVICKEIFRSNGVNISGRAVEREAVRGIIVDQNKLLMLFSPVNRDYKFPGGGVIVPETHRLTLSRELQEECGARLLAIESLFGKVIEYDFPLEREFDVFKMTSYFYICSIDMKLGKQNLDPYELELDFQPVWVEINLALVTNIALMNTNQRSLPKWTTRDTFVLSNVQKWIMAEKAE